MPPSDFYPLSHGCLPGCKRDSVTALSIKLRAVVGCPFCGGYSSFRCLSQTWLKGAVTGCLRSALLRKKPATRVRCLIFWFTQSRALAGAPVFWRNRQDQEGGAQPPSRWQVWTSTASRFHQTVHPMQTGWDTQNDPGNLGSLIWARDMGSRVTMELEQAAEERAPLCLGLALGEAEGQQVPSAIGPPPPEPR